MTKTENNLESANLDAEDSLDDYKKDVEDKNKSDPTYNKRNY